MPKRKKVPARAARGAAARATAVWTSGMPQGRLRTFLVDSHAARRRRATTLASSGPLFWTAASEVSDYLGRLADWWPDNAVADLLRQACDDTLRGLDAVLAANATGAAEAGRRLMEVQILLVDFVADPAVIREWAAADSRTRNLKFSFGKCRDRIERRMGLPTDLVLPDRDEYQAHSALVHPGPPVHLHDEEDDELISGVMDLIEHAARVSEAALVLAEADPNVTVDETLPVARSRAVRELRESFAEYQQSLGLSGRAPVLKKRS